MRGQRIAGKRKGKGTEKEQGKGTVTAHTVGKKKNDKPGLWLILII
jgi:hypothetical protein